jgi:hypothetical protein
MGPAIGMEKIKPAINPITDIVIKLLVNFMYVNDIYCFTSSTLRFRALPFSVSLLATGDVGPSPQALRRAAFTENCETSELTTAAGISYHILVNKAGSLLPSASSCANKGAKPVSVNKNKPKSFFIILIINFSECHFEYP